MKIYGYAKGDAASDIPTELKEVSLSLSIAEIESLIMFFQDAKNRFNSCAPTAWQSHRHLRDWQKDWVSSNPDLVIVYEK